MSDNPKRLYSQDIKNSMQEVVQMNKQEAEEILKDQKASLGRRMAAAHVLKDVESPSHQEGTFITKLTGDMTEQVSVTGNEFTNFVKKVQGDHEW